MKEIWKDIPNYEGLYQVSNLGRVKSLDRVVKYKDGRERFILGVIMSPVLSDNGYLLIRPSKKGVKKLFKVHQLVAMAFLNHKPDGHKLVVDHIDNDKLNNRLDNLQIITQRENTSKDKYGKTSKYTGVSWHKQRNKWVARIVFNRAKEYLGSFTNEFDAHMAYSNRLKEINAKF